MSSSADRGDDPVVVRRRMPDGIVSGPIETVFPDWRDEERWLFITPHDDDPAVSAALTLAAGVAAGARIRVRIATDGSMGYTSAVSPEEVVATRATETRRSFDRLGINDVAWFGYPDARLHLWQGRFPADAAPDWTAGATRTATLAAAPSVVAGYTGLTNSITAEFRDFRPNRVFLMSAADYHPDHRIVHQEALISTFHAGGDIWPELGEPLVDRPWIHECAAYSPFDVDPDLEIAAPPAVFEAKLDALAAFASQTQIESLVAAIREAGPREYLRSFRFETYSPTRYHALFSPGGDAGA